jgi:hypothetical protein
METHHGGQPGYRSHMVPLPDAAGDGPKNLELGKKPKMLFHSRKLVKLKRDAGRPSDLLFCEEMVLQNRHNIGLAVKILRFTAPEAFPRNIALREFEPVTAKK